MDKIRVLIADDYRLIRVGLRAILEDSEDVEVVGEAENGYQALDLVEELSPDILLLDYEMPGLNGVQVTSWLCASQCHVKVLAISAYEDKEYVFAFFKAGAAGFLSKRDAPKYLIQAIREVYAGQQGWVSQRVAKKIAEVQFAGDERSYFILGQRQKVDLDR